MFQKHSATPPEYQLTVYLFVGMLAEIAKQLWYLLRLGRKMHNRRECE